ncbi:MAG: LysM peptidoglycan-binding domain-containing M23 family metallopeptidase [Anaerolineae bacterium]|nr:LysM peptidoglycan-binding domain-containing M23 family metallopeptidase [Anaerolineae bacterium]
MSDHNSFIEDNFADSQSLFQQLAEEEPPVNLGDTSPSATAPRPINQYDADWQRYLGGSILLAALLLTMAAGLIIFLGNQDENDNTDEAQQNSTKDAPVVIIRPSLTPEIENPPVQNAGNPTGGIRSTAAPDEQAVSLLTPVPSSADSGPAIGRDNNPFTFQVGSGERGFTNYVIQQGDTLDSITKKFGLEDVCTIIWSNDRNKVSPPRVNAEILIPPTDGVFARVREPITIKELAEATQVDPSVIIDSAYNTQLLGATADSMLIEGVSVLVPGGNGGDCNVWEPAPVVAGGDTGSSVSGGVANSGLWGCNAQVSTTGFPVQKPLPSGTYEYWQGFSAAHTGVDLAAPVGTTIMAAGSGTVVYAGWNQYGYGKVVVIAHGSSYTLYAHMDSYSVSCGQSVSQGQAIGTIGMTGRTSGPHLHFEIRDSNFQAMDPVYTISGL